MLPQSHAQQVDCLQKLNQILGFRGKAKKGEEAEKMHEVCLRTKSAKFSTARHAIYTFNIAHIASVSLDPVSKQILAKLGDSGIPPYLGIWRIFGVLPEKYGELCSSRGRDCNVAIIKSQRSAGAPFIAASN